MCRINHHLCLAITHNLILIKLEIPHSCKNSLNSSKAYGMKLSPLEQKILMNIQLGVICAEMVDLVDLVTHQGYGKISEGEILLSFTTVIH